MSARSLELAIILGGRVSPSLRTAFGFANSQAAQTARQMERHSSGIGTMSKGILSFAGKTAAALATLGGAAGVAAGLVGKNAVMLASDLNEVQNVVDVTFGGGAKQINAWSQTALKSYGLAELQAKQYTGTMGAMLKSMGITGDNLFGMSTNLAGLAGDFASFYNLEHDDAWEKIRSGISGETEPLKALGINMSVANMEAYALSKGIKTSYQDMDQASQAALRYSYLMNTSKDAQGDFARTQGGFANQLRLVKTNFDQFTAKLATNLLPVLTKGLVFANGFMDKLAGDPSKLIILQNGIMKVAGVISNLVTDVGPQVWSFISTLAPMISNFTQGLLPMIIPLILTLGKLGLYLVNSVIKPLIPIVMSIIKAVLPTLTNLMNILIPIVQNLASKFMAIVQQVLPPLLSLWASLSAAITALAPTLQWIGNLIVTFFYGAIQNLMPIVMNVIGIFKGLLDFITGTFTGNWALAWQGIKDVIVNVFKGIANIVLYPINEMINKINTAIIGINTMKLPDWVPGLGGKSFNIPTIPTIAFATGGTVTRPTFGLLGEAGVPETMIPHTNTPRSRSLLADAAAGVGMSLGSSINITFAPVIYGSVDVKQALQEAYVEFEAKVDRLFREKARLSYG